MIKLFGTTIKETIAAFDLAQHLEGDNTQGSKGDLIKAWGRLIISVLLLAFAVFCLNTENKQLGASIIGAITGYWIK